MDSTSSCQMIAKQGLDSALLSFAQERLWFLDQLNPGNPTYNTPTAIHFKGLLDVKALEQSLGEIIQRHEALRTTFTAVDGQLLQVIASSSNWMLQVVDLKNLSLTERQQESQRLIIESVEQPFDLGTGPLLRGVLQRLGEIEHILLLTVHEIVCDGWSLNILLQELASLYEAFSNGLLPPLVELPIQYSDFAIWQHEWLQSEVSESHLGYWKQQLGGEFPILELPIDHPRPPVQTYRGARQSLNLSKDLTDALKELSQQSGVTLFTTLLTAFKTLLYRYTSIEDIIVGSSVFNRNQHETEGLIGLFAKNLVMRTDLSGNPSFRELLSRVQSVVLSAYSHQDLPFEKLVEELQTERDLSRSPLFQVMFAFQSDRVSALEFPGLSVNAVEVEKKTAKFDLTLELHETSDGVNGWFEYKADLFDAETIGRMIGHWQVLLSGVVTQPNKQISLLPILTEAERHQLLVEWNDTEVDYPKDKCIHQLFEEQVERTPNNVAVVFEDQQLTYRELNEKANRLAHYLQKLGVGPEVLVGICVERSLEMIIGLLGILKAGAAYVPLDPKYPKERLAFMLEDTQVSVLLTQQHLVEELPTFPTKVICLNNDWEIINRDREAQTTSGVTAENLAYIMYTSGSTGKPKGVMISHRAVGNQIAWRQSDYQLTERDRVLQRAAFSYDPSVYEIFWTLIAGSQLILPRSDLAQDSTYLVKLISVHKITVIGVSPSLLQLFLEGQEIKDCNSLVQVYCGGEALPIGLLKLFSTTLPAKKLCNIYGPTEACIAATSWNTNQEISQRIAPIGRPIANTQIYILDAHLQPLPIGIPGELYIGGFGLAQGYLNLSALNTKKFIPNPFSNKLGERLYKTGDLARYLPDGNIEFLDRLDHQVKIRGFRIELGEIEVVLGQHPSIQKTVVITREDVLGDTRLVAYVVPKQDQIPTSAELRSFLKQKLPYYMTPSAFVSLDIIPLTLSGKIDRRALPIPDRTRSDMKETFVPPRTPVEEMLARIWSKILGLELVGVHDNFFELGGHSLLATKIISQIREIFQVELPLSILFDNSTIASLTSSVKLTRSNHKSTFRTKITKINRVNREQILANINTLSDEEVDLHLKNFY
jgi:amino acid adenylation domain-containing protein